MTNVDFTIISNNCWGGICYEYFGLPKNSPTVGVFFMADEYIKFVSKFEYYIAQDLEFIGLNESKHQAFLKKNNILDVPIGVLDDVEIVFLHYKDSEVAKEKWKRRVKRIKKDNLIFKFSYMNECNREYIEKFEKMSLPGKKLVFLKENTNVTNCGVYYPGFEESEQLENDTFYWNRYFDVVKFINEGIIVRKSPR